MIFILKTHFVHCNLLCFSLCLLLFFLLTLLEAESHMPTWTIISEQEDQGAISQDALQPLVVPASQCLGDVTHVGIGCMLALYPKMTTHCTPLLAPITRALLSVPKRQKQRGCCQFELRQEIILQSSQCCLFNSYILYHLTVKHQYPQLTTKTGFCFLICIDLPLPTSSK